MSASASVSQPTRGAFTSRLPRVPGTPGPAFTGGAVTATVSPSTAPPGTRAVEGQQQSAQAGLQQQHSYDQHKGAYVTQSSEVQQSGQATQGDEAPQPTDYVQASCRPSCEGATCFTAGTPQPWTASASSKVWVAAAGSSQPAQAYMIAQATSNPLMSCSSSQAPVQTPHQQASVRPALSEPIPPQVLSLQGPADPHQPVGLVPVHSTGAALPAAGAGHCDREVVEVEVSDAALSHDDSDMLVSAASEAGGVTNSSIHHPPLAGAGGELLGVTDTQRGQAYSDSGTCSRPGSPTSGSLGVAPRTPSLSALPLLHGPSRLVNVSGTWLSTGVSTGVCA
jgi:hypothetical protein